MKVFRGHVAVITGAASGLGRAFARKAAALEMRLVLADIDIVALQQIARELSSNGTEVLALPCDVSRAEQVQTLADAAISRFGCVHLLFNNAGVGAGGLIWENSAADWEWLLGVNLFGVIHGVRIFTPLMLQASKSDAAYCGHIVNTASVAGLQNAPTMGIYNVSKHAVVSLTETLYQDLALIEAPVGVSLLCPYFVPTAIHASARNRPDRDTVSLTVSQRTAQAFSEKAVQAGKVSAAQFADMTFDAVRENRFYVYSELEPLEHARLRMEDLINASNPRDPYAQIPHVREMLRDRLKNGDI